MEPGPGNAALEADAEHRSPFDPQTSAGLFVGVSSFEDESIPTVPFAVDDAVDLAYLFTLELGLVSPQRAILLLAGEPRKPGSIDRLAELIERGTDRRSARMPDVYRHLKELTEGTAEGGLFILTVATHGVSDQGKDLLLATDSLSERAQRTGVAVDEVFDQVARAHAERRLVLLDACRDRLHGGLTRDIAPRFAEAVARARGSVVLSGATLGGFAYDDEARANGVFTAAVLDGLGGGAPAGPEGWVTVRTLADFVQQQVAAWVHDNRPEHRGKSLGIERRIEATAEHLPLALHREAMLALQRYRARREAAFTRFKANQGTVLRGEHWNQVYALLPAAGPTPESERLLDEIETLDNTERSQRILRDFLRELEGGTSPDVVPQATRQWEVVWWAGAVAILVGLWAGIPYLQPNHRPDNGIGLTALAEPASASSAETYPVRLSWQTPTSTARFDIIRLQLDTDEEPVPIPVPWLLGIPGNGPGSGRDQTYRDSAVLPMTPYRYIVRPLQESVDVKTLGRELVIEGRRRLAEYDLKSRPIHRLVLQNGAELTTEGEDLEIQVTELVAENAVIRTFPDAAVADLGRSGRAGGSISIQARRASGKLTILGNGEKGGKGDAVADQPRAGEGGEGEPGRDSVSGGREERNAYCARPAGRGKQGKTGLPGRKGNQGLPGGDSARIEVSIARTSELAIDVAAEPGAGGDGGDGGKGGEGGPGGQGGKQTSMCPEGAAGPKGTDGLPGEAGDPGTPGRRLDCCVRIGGKPHAACDDCP